ncbi:MAG: hypothetical protein RJA98_948 [Pseudomonadota bacterium]
MPTTHPTTPPAPAPVAAAGRAAPTAVPTNEPRTSAAAAPAPAPAAGVSSVAELIRLEGEIRNLTQVDDLWLHFVNEAGAVLPCAQALVFCARTHRAGQRWQGRLEHAAAVNAVASDGPMARWLEALAAAAHAASGEAAAYAFDVQALGDTSDPSAQQMPLRQGLWLPLPDHRGQPLRAALLLGQVPWEGHAVVIARRLAAAYAHAALAIRGRQSASTWAERWPVARWRVAAAVAGIVLAALVLVRVPLATLAPVEVVPAQPFVVAAAAAGVVERVLVEPGARVRAGTPLVQLVDTTLRNDFEVAAQRLAVAQARTLRVQQAAVDDAAIKHELAMAQTEQAVAQAELDFASDMRATSVLKAAIDGVALFSDPRDWMGRPVAVGEAILRVADPTRTEFHVRVPVADASNVRVGLPVEVYLDAEPLTPRRAVVVRAAYKAEADAAGVASFLVTAHLTDANHDVPRLGLRGTAQILGDDVTLFFYLFRRPLTTLRQTLGV